MPLIQDLNLTFVPDLKSGFLYFARDNSGNVIFNGGYVQVNMLVTDKSGFVKVKERVGYQDGDDFIGYDSNLAFWTNNVLYTPAGYKNGKQIPALISRYMFRKGGYFIIVKHIVETSTVQIVAYDGNNNLLGGTAISGVTGINYVQANKTTTELLLAVAINNSVTHATGFVINNGWEKIFRLSIDATNDSPPFDFPILSQKLQCKFFTVHHNVNSTFSKSSTVIDPPVGNNFIYQFSFSESYTVTSTGVCYGIDGGDTIVLQCYYDNDDVYREDTFQFISVSNNFEHSRVFSNCFFTQEAGQYYIRSSVPAHAPPLSGGTITTATTESYYTLNYKVNGVACHLTHKTANAKSETLSSFYYQYYYNTEGFRGLFNTIGVGVGLGHTHVFLQDEVIDREYSSYNKSLFSTRYYSKVSPVVTTTRSGAAALTITNTITDDPTGIFSAYNVSFACNDYDFNSTLLDSFPVIDDFDGWNINAQDFCTATYRVFELCLNQAGKIITDKHNNHLAVVSGNIRFSDKNAISFINLEPTILGSGFYQFSDFIGAI